MGTEERLTYSIEETGRLLGLSRATTYTLANQGKLPVLRLGKRLIVPRQALEQMLANAGKPN